MRTFHMVDWPWKVPAAGYMAFPAQHWPLFQHHAAVAPPTAVQMSFFRIVPRDHAECSWRSAVEVPNARTTSGRSDPPHTIRQVEGVGLSAPNAGCQDVMSGCDVWCRAVCPRPPIVRNGYIDYVQCVSPCGIAAHEHGEHRSVSPALTLCEMSAFQCLRGHRRRDARRVAMLPRSLRVGTIHTWSAVARDRSRAAYGAIGATISLPGIL